MLGLGLGLVLVVWGITNMPHPQFRVHQQTLRHTRLLKRLCKICRVEVVGVPPPGEQVLREPAGPPRHQARAARHDLVRVDVSLVVQASGPQGGRGK